MWMLILFNLVESPAAGACPGAAPAVPELGAAGDRAGHLRHSRPTQLAEETTVQTESDRGPVVSRNAVLRRVMCHRCSHACQWL